MKILICIRAPLSKSATPQARRSVPLHRKKGPVFLFKFILSALLMGLVFYHVPVTDLLQRFQGVLWGWLAAALLIAIVSEWVNAKQMALILQAQSIHLATAKVCRINLLTYFYSLFLPGTLAGGAVRWYHFSRGNQRPTEALAAILFNRLLETALLIILGLLFWLWEQEAAQEVLRGPALILISATLLALYAFSFTRRFYTWMHGLITLRFIPLWASGRLQKLLDCMRTFSGLGLSFHMAMIVLGLARNLIMIISLYFLALSLELSLSLAALAWVRCCITLLLILPISIGGFGLREGAFVLLLAPYGIAPAQALALSFLQLSRNLVFAIIGGLSEAWILWRPGTDNAHQKLPEPDKDLS